MQVKITRTTVADAMIVREGKVYDLSDVDARLLIQIGKAVAVSAEAAAPEVLDTNEADAVVDTGTPKRKGRKRGSE